MRKHTATAHLAAWALAIAACGFGTTPARAQARRQLRRANSSPKAATYLAACRRFADVVIEHGRDKYGPKHTPLFVDGLHTETLDPVVWRARGEKWILSNFANHQSLLRLLDGLTALTGDRKYRQAGLDASAYALKNLRTKNGLMYWGGHLAWDVGAERAVYGQKSHELRNQSPYYRMLWAADAAETKRLMQTIWGGHVWDWGTLDFNRHARSIDRPAPPQWSHEFNESMEVPFPTESSNLSFANFAGPLLHTGAALARLGKDKAAAAWTRRFAYRWRQAADPRTGLCGGQLSYRKEDRARIALGHVHPQITEANMVATYHRESRYEAMALIELQAGEALGGPLGKDLIRWASEDLKAYARHAYDAKSNTFRSLVADGTELRGAESRSFYYRKDALGPRKPHGRMAWVYATAYRLTKDPAHWDLLRKLCIGQGYGDIGSRNGRGRKLNPACRSGQFESIYALLDLARATGDRNFLKLAARVGDNILGGRTPDRCFPTRYKYVRTGDEQVLALVHLAAALAGKSRLMPPPARDQQYFHCIHDDAKKRQVGPGKYDQRTWDWTAVYKKPRD